MSDEIQLPCETCITKAICKYKIVIQCSLLLTVYKSIKEFRSKFRSNRVLERALSKMFDWEYDSTLVVENGLYILVTDVIGRSPRYKQDTKMTNEIRLPCETCITRPVCKYKKYIQCSLLIEVYDHVDSPYNFIKITNKFFGWKEGYTLVLRFSDHVLITDFLSHGRIDR